MQMAIDLCIGSEIFFAKQLAGVVYHLAYRLLACLGADEEDVVGVCYDEVVERVDEYELVAVSYGNDIAGGSICYYLAVLCHVCVAVSGRVVVKCRPCAEVAPAYVYGLDIGFCAFFDDGGVDGDRRARGEVVVDESRFVGRIVDTQAFVENGGNLRGVVVESVDDG